MPNSEKKNSSVQESKPRCETRTLIEEPVNEPNIHSENEKLSKDSLTADVVKSVVDEILGNKLDDLKKGIADSLKPFAKDLCDNFNALVDQLGKLEIEQVECSKELKQLKKDYSDHVKKQNVISELVNSLREENESLLMKLEEKQSAIVVAEKNLNETQLQLQKVEKEKNTMIKWIAKIFGADEIASSMENMKCCVDEIQKKMKDQGVKIESLETMVKTQKETISVKEHNIHCIKDECTKKISELNAISNQKLRDAKQEFDAQMGYAKEKYAQMEQNLSSKLTEKETICKNFEGEIGKLTKSLKDLKNCLEMVQKENEEKEKTIKLQDEKLNEVIEEKKTLVSSLTQFSSLKQKFKNAMKPYIDILEFMRKCDSMHSAIVDSLGLPATGELSIEQQIMYVNKFADKFTFARIVYDSMKSYKESTTEALTENELAAIRSLNEFYRQRFFIKFDALDCGIASGCAFDRKKMKLISDPSNTDVINVSFLCVPALYMMNGKDLEQKALIQGS